MTKKAYKAMVFGLSAAFALAACNPATSENTTQNAGDGVKFTKEFEGSLKIYGFNPSDEVGSSRGDLATAAVKPAKVSLDTTNFDSQKFAAQAASGDVPDLIQLDRQTVGTLADKKLIMPLDKCYDLWDRDPNYFYKAALDEVTYDGSIYAVPQFYQTAMIIGNKNVMEPAGVTAEDLDTSKPEKLLEAAKKMYQEKGGNPSVIGFDPDVPGSSGIWLNIFGGQVMEEDGKPSLDNPKNVEALKFLTQLLDEQGGFAKSKSLKDTMDVFGEQNQYVTNQVGAQMWAQWYINVLADTKDNVSLVGVPLRGADGKTFGQAGGTAFAIPTKSKNPSAACGWIMNATSLEAWEAAGSARAEKVKAEGSINTGLFTASPEADKLLREKFVTASGNEDFDQLIATSYEALEGDTRSSGGSAVGQQIDDALKNAVAQAAAGKDPEQALKEAQEDAIRAWEQSEIGKR